MAFVGGIDSCFSWAVWIHDVFFFFSSRRRHTRSLCDWSSDVCSSDLGVAVLNINELANSLKPVVLPGEVLRVFVLKEGKEQGQGVAYLDDGTMVVVDQGKKAMGRTIEVTVTSVLQTTAGKMIFCRWPEAAAFPEGAEARREARPA